MTAAPTHGDDSGRSAFNDLQLESLKTADYLKAEPKLSGEQKAVLAGYLARGLSAGGGETGSETEAILRLMIWNAEPVVLEAAARAAAVNPHTPRNVAWALANDDEAAAVHVLELSLVLTDADLVSIVQSSGNITKMNSIARRPAVSADVSRLLVHHGDETTAHTLLGNARAEISEDAYGAVLDRFGASARIQESVIDRDALFPAIAQRLSHAVESPRLKEKLIARGHEAPALPGFSDDRSEEEWNDRLSRMIAEKSLNEATLVRALCDGNFDFFARALAVKTRSSAGEMRLRLMNGSNAELSAAWSNAVLPADWLPVAAAALAALIEIDRTAAKSDRQLFSRNVIDRALANLRVEKVSLTEAQRRVLARR